ncbi:hypothetical protein EMQ25_11720 [Arsenicitalea aurantiaca]|uniref:Uncharacterized protein n=1 Tax=Arsenicitalea aurantiaca TaxID=1783274 RepID=A0A433X7H7_9HYPH|nr:hypothetical protein [Arsenicitalea aurantiaca]RUT29998.1 hypothetical protein EMQ25_11720 [Arsenicitalea aurantiaca]
MRHLGITRTQLLALADPATKLRTILRRQARIDHLTAQIDRIETHIGETVGWPRLTIDFEYDLVTVSTPAMTLRLVEEGRLSAETGASINEELRQRLRSWNEATRAAGLPQLRHREGHLIRLQDKSLHALLMRSSTLPSAIPARLIILIAMMEPGEIADRSMAIAADLLRGFFDA